MIYVSVQEGPRDPWDSLSARMSVSMCTCVYVCLYVFMYVCIGYMSLFRRGHVTLSARMSVSMYVCMRVYTCVCTGSAFKIVKLHAYMHVWMYGRMDVHVGVEPVKCVYTHAYIYGQILCIYMHAAMPWSPCVPYIRSKFRRIHILHAYTHTYIHTLWICFGPCRTCAMIRTYTYYIHTCIHTYLVNMLWAMQNMCHD